MKKIFGFLQQIGKSLMLPVSVLPVAGILLGVGSSKFSWIPVLLSSVMAKSGDAIFSNLPLIFAIGVALGLTGNDGVSALAAVVGYFVLLATMGVVGAAFGQEVHPVAGIPTLETGVFGGILAGAMAAYLFKRFYRIELPPYLGFFAGKRFVPIITALSAVVLGVVLSVAWPPIQGAIHAFSNYAAYGNPHLAVFLYGTVERLLIPFGLHHIWNVPFFFEMGSFTDATGKVVHGDITRFFAGDPEAGILGGAYLFKMWGLPAAAIAMWHSARPERKAEVGGIMVSAALTSFLTGITEPIEFAFLFLAPVLYGIHALLAGSAFLIMQMLGGKLGFTFSHGFIDFVLYYAKDTKPWLVLILGPIYALIYYTAFRTVIKALDLKTPGREDAMVEEEGGSGGSLATQILEALGGASNISSLDACITRLRVGLVNMGAAQPDRLKQLGAAGVMVVGNNLQAIFGTRSENLKTDIEMVIRSGPAVTPQAPVAAAPVVVVAAVVAEPLDAGRTERLKGALGGANNVLEAQPLAVTRVRVKLTDASKVDEAALRNLGAYGVMPLKDGVVHVLVGEECGRWAASLTKKA